MGIGLLEKTRVGKLLRRAALISEQSLFVQVMSKKEVRDFAVKLNVEQMTVYFMDSEETPLYEKGGEYAPSTMQKGKKKSPTSIDLHDTGKFHDSFEVVRITGEQFEIESEHMKGSTDLLVEWGKEIEGLTFENKRTLALFMLSFYKQKILKHLLD